MLHDEFRAAFFGENLVCWPDACAGIEIVFPEERKETRPYSAVCMCLTSAIGVAFASGTAHLTL